MIEPDNVRKAHAELVNAIADLENAAGHFGSVDLRHAVDGALENLRGAETTIRDELDHVDSRPHDRGRGLTQSAVQDAFDTVSGLDCDDCPSPNHCALNGCIDPEGGTL